MPVALLLAMQAAGMIVDYMGTKHQEALNAMGQRVEEAGIESNINQIRLQAEDESLQALKSLRQNLGTQIATNASRGTLTGAGNALGFMTESLSESKSDERMRRLNLLGKENQLRAGIAMSRLNNMTSNTKLWQSFAQRSLNSVNTQSFQKFFA